MARQALSVIKKKRKKRGKRSTIKTKGKDKKVLKCNTKEQQFVDEYLVDLNGRRAYQAVYPDSNNLTARVEACRFLTKPNVSEAISLRRQELSAQVQVTQDEIVREFVRVGISANIKDYASFGPSGVKLKESNELTDAQLAMVAEVSHSHTEHGSNVKFKLHDKMDALNSLARHLGMFPSRVEQPSIQIPVQFNIVLSPSP